MVMRIARVTMGKNGGDDDKNSSNGEKNSNGGDQNGSGEG